MKVQELKDAVKKIMTSEFKETEKKKGIKELTEHYSEVSNTPLTMAKQYIQLEVIKYDN